MKFDTETPLYIALKNMNYEELEELAKEIRNYIFTVVYNNNGHLASNLGVVELTIALYRVFDPFEDIVIWDTSHQSYVHKLLTGRWKDFKNIRKKDGISGYTNIHESQADRFGAGHAGTSIAAALGYAIADKIKGVNRNIVSIIGDGALGCGMALESLNQLSYQGAKIKIILNDNNMAISKNVGSLSTLLNNFRVKKEYTEVKKVIKDTLEEHHQVGKDFENLLRRVRDSLKYSLYNSPAAFFEDMGIKYYGPVDGHNIKKLEEFLSFVKDYKENSVLLHVVTKKGKGFEETEAYPTKFHGVSKSNAEKLSYSKVVGYTLAHLKNYQFVVFTGAMAEGTGLDILQNVDNNKVIDMGITEASIVTTAAAVSLGGKILPIVDVYSTFMQRAFDSLIHDVALQEIPVLFLLDRAGLVGEDGPTHHGVFDISYTRLIPNVEIWTPLDAQDLANMVYTSIIKGINKPRFIRFPRDGEKVDIKEILDKLQIVDNEWKYLKKQKESNVYVLAVGTLSKNVYEALKTYDVNIIGVRSVKPLDIRIIKELKERAETILVYEEGSLKGGFNEEIFKIRNKNVYSYGIDDEFIPHASRKEQLEYCGLSIEKIRKNYEKIFNNNKVR
ncbi:1-deoxy-D-xylulose-5-phosphate synthase [Petrotoga sp. 9PWA.NaAc.5.4]|uniref:1-deoxy-D-xylulose-5-phosphate synthase n=1 Tax=Petrotoga sp. 9PWA.NaAc.5.4 TaxID=1434328 RepID=UPI000CB604F9|nr:1-deoxy-D-xylulose-5-phosphate synthase [Petrotoga sp. 9PWA.NaAc.5.4]PNR93674.1 1-deoxy-D-xylulose-5-phosphate synthase [Petrotoga sp. 9PWA.NaAc.5.4]